MDDQIIEIIRNARAKWVHFLKNTSKPERERWIVKEFLKTLSISFLDEELVSQVEASNIDVIFRELSFQVKELTEPDCRRTSDANEDLRRAQSAKSVSELEGPLEASENITRDAYPAIQSFASDRRYPLTERSKLDLLIYVTDTGAVLNLANQPKALYELGWRSISCLYGPHAYVLVAVEDAPELIRKHLSVSRLK